MSIDFGNCDALECWYKRNPEELSGYSEYNFVSNFDSESTKENLLTEGIEVYDNGPPYFFTLCDVCWDNSFLKIHGTCSLCDRKMIDAGLTIGLKTYCRDCYDIPTLTKLVYKYNPDFRNSKDAPRHSKSGEWDIPWQLINKESNPKLFEQIEKAIEADENEDKAFIENCKKRKRENNNRVEIIIGGFLPGVSSETCKRIRKTFDIANVPNSSEALLKEICLTHELSQVKKW